MGCSSLQGSHAKPQLCTCSQRQPKQLAMDNQLFIYIQDPWLLSCVFFSILSTISESISVSTSNREGEGVYILYLGLGVVIFSFYHLKQPRGLPFVQHFAVSHRGAGPQRTTRGNLCSRCWMCLHIPLGQTQMQDTRQELPCFASALFQLMERIKHAHCRGK